MSNRPAVWATPADLFNSLGVTGFLKKEIIMLFGPPQNILSGNDLMLDCKAEQDLAYRFNIQWKCTSTCASLENALYEYRRRSRPGGMGLFEILFGVKPSFAIESSSAIPGEAVSANARPFGLAVALINRAERWAPNTLQKGAYYQTGDRMLLPEGSKFETKMWLDLFKVVVLDLPHYVLENAPGRKSWKSVNFRRLLRNQEKNEQHSPGH